MRFTLLFLLILPCAGQTVPNAPSFERKHIAPSFEKKHNVWTSPFRDPYFYIGTGFHASSVIADVSHVQYGERHGLGFEANPGADKYKNRIPEIALMAGANYGCSLMLSEYKRWRFLCLAFPVTIGIIHWHDARTIEYLR